MKPSRSLGKRRPEMQFFACCACGGMGRRGRRRAGAGRAVFGAIRARADAPSRPDLKLCAPRLKMKLVTCSLVAAREWTSRRRAPPMLPFFTSEAWLDGVVSLRSLSKIRSSCACRGRRRRRALSAASLVQAPRGVAVLRDAPLLNATSLLADGVESRRPDQRSGDARLGEAGIRWVCGESPGLRSRTGVAARCDAKGRI